jgi:hypothetical protein
MKTKRMVLVVFLSILMAACETESTQIRDPRTEKVVDIQTDTFTIVCDLDKGLGLAYIGTGDAKVGGMLSAEDYNRFCVTAAEVSGKPTISR